MGTHVLYRGKKPELLLRMKYLSREYRVRNGYVTEMTDKDAKALIEKNPVPFSVVAPGNPEHKVPVKSKKYPSQMNKIELVEHAKEHGVEVAETESKREIRNKIAKLEKTASKKPKVKESAEPKGPEKEVTEEAKSANDGRSASPGN
jgi:hypothetical protein